MLEVAQLLACENLEEIENFLREQGYISSDFSGGAAMVGDGDAAGVNRHLTLEEIRDFLLARDDLELT